MYVTTWPISKRGNKWEKLSYEAWMDGRTAVCHNKPVFWRAYKNEWPISWNYEYIIFGQIIFQNFHQFKACVGLSNCRIIATAPSLSMIFARSVVFPGYSFTNKTHRYNMHVADILRLKDLAIILTVTKALEIHIYGPLFSCTKRGWWVFCFCCRPLFDYAILSVFPILRYRKWLIVVENEGPNAFHTTSQQTTLASN